MFSCVRRKSPTPRAKLTRPARRRAAGTTTWRIKLGETVLAHAKDNGDFRQRLDGIFEKRIAEHHRDLLDRWRIRTAPGTTPPVTTSAHRGWKPNLPDHLVGALIVVRTHKGGEWTTKIKEVIEQNNTGLIVRTEGRQDTVAPAATAHGTPAAENDNATKGPEQSSDAKVEPCRMKQDMERVVARECGSLARAVAQSWRAFDRAAGLPCVTPAAPILFFGDLVAYGTSALRVLTVRLNPSLHEFPHGEPFRRFPLLEGAGGREPGRYLDAMTGYFRTDPYRAWFSAFEPLLNGAGASYYAVEASTALHTPTSARLSRPAPRGANSTGPTMRPSRPTAARSGTCCWRRCGRRSWCCRWRRSTLSASSSPH